MAKYNSASPARFQRLSYRNVGCTSIYSVAEVHSRIRQGSVVSPPKASRFIKFPQRPTAWPINRPITPRSAKAPKDSFRFRQKASRTKKAVIIPP